MWTASHRHPFCSSLDSTPCESHGDFVSNEENKAPDFKQTFFQGSVARIRIRQRQSPTIEFCAYGWPTGSGVGKCH